MQRRKVRGRWGAFVEATAWVLVGALSFGVPGLTISSAAAADGRASVGAVGAALTIATDPVGASIYVDGKLRGESPITVDRVAAGEHRVRVSMDGYLENSRVVVMDPGESESLRVNLTPNGTQMARLQVEPETPTAPPPPRPIIKAKEGGGKGKKIALFALGAAVVGGGVYLLLPKNSPPTVTGVTAEPPSSTKGLASATTYRFSAQASDPDSGDTLTYNWDFGDGQTSTQSSATHVFAGAGSFNVTLTVTDKKGESAAGSVRAEVVSLNGNWRGTLAGFIDILFHVTQNGENLSGSFETPGFPITDSFTGRVNAPRNVVINLSSYDDVFRGELSEDGNTITGTDLGDPFSVTRE